MNTRRTAACSVKSSPNFQNTQFKLADLKTKATVARVFTDRCISLFMEGKLDPVDAAMAKMFTSELHCEAVDECLQLFGGWGYMTEYPIARAYVDARIVKIAGGSIEIMKTIIARQMIRSNVVLRCTKSGSMRGRLPARNVAAKQYRRNKASQRSAKQGVRFERLIRQGSDRYRRRPGTGRAITLRLAEEGCKVAIFDINPDAGHETAKLAPKSAITTYTRRRRRSRFGRSRGRAGRGRARPDLGPRQQRRLGPADAVPEDRQGTLGQDHPHQPLWSASTPITPSRR